MKWVERENLCFFTQRMVRKTRLFESWEVLSGEYWTVMRQSLRPCLWLTLSAVDVQKNRWGVMVVVRVWRFWGTHLAAASVGMKEAVGAVYHLQLCDPAIIQGCSVPVYNDGFSQLLVVEVDAHRLQRSSAKKVWRLWGATGADGTGWAASIRPNQKWNTQGHISSLCWPCLRFRGSLDGRWTPECLLERGWYWPF